MMDIQKEIERIAYKLQTSYTYTDQKGFTTMLGSCGDNFKIRSEIIAEEVLKALGEFPQVIKPCQNHKKTSKSITYDKSLVGKKVLLQNSVTPYNLITSTRPDVFDLNVTAISPSGLWFLSGVKWYSTSRIVEILD